MEPVKNYNIPVHIYTLLDAEEREAFDEYMENINCTYCITE